MDVNTPLTILFVNFYNEQKAKGKTFIPDTIVAKYVLLKKYNEFLREELLIPIEDLLIEEKKKLVDECRLMEDKNYANQSLTESCRVLHLIEFINLNS